MFSVITNIYNKKTKGPTLMELFTATGKMEKFLFTTGAVRCVHHGWHGTHQYNIQVLTTHASKWVHRYSSLLQWSVTLGQRGHVGGYFAYFARNSGCTVITDLLVLYSNTQNDFSPGAAIFSLHTLTSPIGRSVNYDEKQLWKKKVLNSFFYLCRFRKYMSYGIPIINYYNPEVHYETPCIYTYIYIYRAFHNVKTCPTIFFL